MTLLHRLALSAAGCLAAATLSHADSTSTEYLGRIGFYDSTGYTGTDGSQLSTLSTLSTLLTPSDRFVAGASTRYTGTTSIGYAGWVYDTQASATTRVGFYTGSEYTRSDGTQATEVKAVLLNNLALASSNRYSGSSYAGKAASLTDLSTGVVTRIGLYSGTEFTSSANAQDTTINNALGNYVIGNSYRYNGSTQIGQAAWYADAATGVTTRIGLVSADFTKSDGTQSSNPLTLTNSGYVRGTSSIYSSSTAGTALWLANLATGTTARVGLYSDEFTSSDTYQYSAALTTLTESGYLTGSSYRYNKTPTQLGQGAWVANAATGTTTRIGLYTGSEFTKSDGSQTSTPSACTESGYVIGTTARYDGGSTQLGQAAWLANAATGVTARVGLYSDEFTKSDGYQTSTAARLTESGYAVGTSYRYNGGATQLGQAAWYANAATGITTRTGFYTSAQYTKSDGTQSSNVNGITESGYAYGISNAYYTGVASASVHTWIVNTATGNITRTGLYGNDEFRASNGTESSSNSGSSPSSYVYGTSTRYNNGTTTLGLGAWVANAATGATTRVGLYTGPEYTTLDGSQSTTINGVYDNGYLYGTSSRFSGTSSSTGTAGWVANATTGVTTRVGLTDVLHTSSTGYQISNVTGIVNGLYVYGASTRYTGINTKGQNAWIFNLATSAQVAFDFSARASDNYGSSTISGITDSGLAYGIYTLFDGETNLGNRAFIWTEDWGTVILDDAFSTQIAQNGWDAFMSVNTILPENIFFGYGVPGGATSTSQGIYMAQVTPVPEPATLGLISLGLATTLLAARRRRA